MTSFRVAPNAYHWLEWGQASPQPGSLVRDALDAPVFTGSRVCLARDADATGVVASLVDQVTVELSWDDGRRRDRRVKAANLRVLVALPPSP